jgi:GcrA cell cycle regulator
MGVVWTEEMLTCLKERHAAGGLSTRGLSVELSKIFGKEITRNAIIGKLHRLGLTDKDKRTLAPKKPTASHPGRIATKLVAKIVPCAAPVVKVASPTAQVFRGKEVKGGMTASIHELCEGTCKWPLGSFMDRPPYAYCGGHALAGRPYCAHHDGVAHEPLKPRTRVYLQR